MSIHKTVIDQSEVAQFLKKYLGVSRVSTELMSDGESSEAFAFEYEGQQLVIRISRHGKHGFLKDRFAHSHFASDNLPIPKILDIGAFDEGPHYAISTRAPGKTLDKFVGNGLETLIPKELQLLDTIHAISPPGEGFGAWDEHGKGRSSSWRDEVISSLHRDDEETKGADFYDAKLHEKLQAKVTKLAEKLPEERRLVHADFSFNNVVSDGRKITGVLDWEMSMYGDPLYDVAWLCFWGTKRDYQATFRKHYEEQGRLPDNFDMRILAYKLQIALNSLGFFARSRQLNKYEFAQHVVVGIIDKV